MTQNRVAMDLPSQVVQSRLRLRGSIWVQKVDAGMWAGGDLLPFVATGRGFL
uniref:Uncharacterized protein n=1 Tax=Physcomitrium patens TaxID=3218 RepID=A0A2K1K8H2_PHYPA|nr:hypothetical protein PHYPA_011974 [Physcomitrium patens]PNR50084.1 hypothetical protein PHYPA_011981 [Physcomitrium patens]